MMIGDDSALPMMAANELAGVMPMLVGLLVIGALIKVAAKTLPIPEMQRNVLTRVAGAALSISLISIGAFVLLTLVTVNMSALKAQRDFETIIKGIDRDMARRSFGG